MVFSAPTRTSPDRLTKRPVAPTPVAFFPITVFRLDSLSGTEQRVWSPGVDVQAVLTPAARHVVTTGLTFYRDRSSDVEPVRALRPQLPSSQP